LRACLRRPLVVHSLLAASGYDAGAHSDEDFRITRKEAGSNAASVAWFCGTH
jgi:hypothetical protein